jgi:Fe-S cluster assembly protein SufD
VVGPTQKNEAWRFTRLSSLDKQCLSAADASATPAFSSFLPENLPAGAHLIRFHNGLLVDNTLDQLPEGIVVSELNDQTLRDLIKLVPSDHPVSDLSVAAMTSGLCLDVTPGTRVIVPIILIFTGDNKAVSTHPVVLLRLGVAAHAVVAEWHETAVGLSAPLLGIKIGDQARLDYAKVQNEGAETSHLAATGITIGENAALDGFQLSIGGCLARLEAHVLLAAESSSCCLSAIYLGRGTQHHDITTNMTHARGHCKSNQVIRGVLDDKARGVFQGKVSVAQDAQKTDGQQMSRALLLSRKAEADAKPELEIYADDVVCAHGATVGELDETQLFYLTSRGIHRDVARAMLISAFLDEAVDTIDNLELASILRPKVNAWMQLQEEVGHD